MAISGLFFGSLSPETKSYLDVGAAKRRKEYYMREGGGFPQVRAVMSFVNRRSLMACLSTKSAPESEVTNLLVGLITTS